MGSQISGMHRLRLAALFVVAIRLLDACTRGDAPRARDSTAVSIPQDTARVTARVTDWDSQLGALLLVPSDSDNSAVVLFPAQGDDSATAASRVTLISASGDTGRAVVTRTDSLECGDAPMVRLSDVPAGTWTVGTVGRSAPVVHMDSIESLPPADSARLAADIARLASALPMPERSRFGGLPFAVVSARRFEADGRQFVAAHLARRVNQEAQPLEERTFVIAERPSGSTERYTVAYHVRSEGNEDTAEHFDALAALHGRQTLFVLIARDQLSGTKYELLERAADGAWRVRWSRVLSC
jgi:hypothetical protein